MKISSLYKEYLVQSVLLILVLLGLVFFVIWPAFATILDYKQRIAEENKSLENKLAMGLNAKKIKEQLDTAEKSASSLDDVYIKSGDELALLGNLESIASTTGVVIALKPDFNLQPVDKTTKRLPLDISVTGKLKNLMLFANSLDNTPYYYVFNSFSLSKESDEIQSLSLSGQFYVKTPAQDSAK